MLYEYRWKLDDRSADANRRTWIGYLPAPGAVTESLRERSAALAALYERDAFNTVVMPELHALCTRYIVQALMKLGWSFGSAETFTTESLAGILGVVPEHRRLFGRMLEILVEDGVLKKDSQYLKCVSQPADGDPANGWRTLILQHPSYHAELTLLHRCGSRLHEVLKGKEDPLSLIFPKHSLVAEHLYQDSPTFRFYNRLMQLVMGVVVERTPEEQPLKILEIGAGTGSMAMQLLPVLPAHRSRYVFTDISRVFTTQAEQKFRSASCVDFMVLDIEKDPGEQGFQPHSFDIVLASDVLHATADLRNTMANVMSLLAPGGLLLLLEVTKPTRWFDLVFGMLAGWWLFTDNDIRPSHPLMSKTGWLSLLSSLGFPEVEAIPAMEGENEPQHSIIIARAPCITDARSPAAPGEKPGSSGESRAQTGRPWLILGDGGDISRRIAGQLKERGVSPALVSRGDRFEALDSGSLLIRPDQPEDFTRLLDIACPEVAAPPVVIDVIGVDDPEEEITGGSLEKTTTAECSQVLYLLQALMSREWSSPPALWLVTGGTQAVGGIREPVLMHTPVWSLGRVMTTEFANLETRMVDLSPAPSDREMQVLCDDLLSPDSEDELALRDDLRYIRRLVRREESRILEQPETPCRLHAARSKGFDGLSFRETPRRKPGPGEVEIQVKATGLNFKDVAKVAGLLDTTALADQGLQDTLGMECSGVIAAVGEGVKDFAVGDEVMGVVLDCFSGYTTTDPRALVHKPPSMSFEEAATIPLVFLASWYALKECARIKQSDRVLIHSAAGGVGLSAIQVARAAGTDIFATAGTPEKRDFLRALGIPYVGDSRSMAFVGEIMEVTSREGVDIVLNTLNHRQALIVIEGVYSVGMSPPNTAAALTALRLLRKEPQRVRRLRENAQLFLDLARSHSLNTGASRDSAVIPVIMGQSLPCVRLYKELFDRGIYVLPIMYPTVPENSSRLRFFIRSTHTEEQIRATIAALAETVPGLVS